MNYSPEPACIFPAPWRAEEFSDGYRIRDANRRVLAYVIAGEKIAGAKSNELTREEAGRIAKVFAALPDLIQEARLDDYQPDWSWWKWLKPALGRVSWTGQQNKT